MLFLKTITVIIKCFTTSKCLKGIVVIYITIFLLSGLSLIFFIKKYVKILRFYFKKYQFLG